MVIAYEPIWAIGTGPGRHRRGRPGGLRLDPGAWWASRRGAEAAERCGSSTADRCSPENTESLMDCPDVDGALVGGASLDAAAFVAIIAGRDRWPGRVSLVAFRRSETARGGRPC